MSGGGGNYMNATPYGYTLYGTAPQPPNPGTQGAQTSAFDSRYGRNFVPGRQPPGAGASFAGAQANWPGAANGPYNLGPYQGAWGGGMSPLGISQAWMTGGLYGAPSPGYGGKNF